jgi:hypothetical protein
LASDGTSAQVLPALAALPGQTHWGRCPQTPMIFEARR